MNIKIKKLQYGGFQATAIPPSQQSTQQQQTSSAQGASAEDLLPKAVLSELIQKGMPSDVEQFYKLVEDFSKNDFSNGLNKQELYKLQALSNRIIQNANYMDKAVTNAEKNEALEDYAVDQRGFIYVIDSNGKLASKSFADFDSSKDRALSVNELIQYRRFDPNMAYQVDVVNTIGNSVGIEKINEYIFKILEKVGKSTTKQESYIDVANIVGQQSAKEPSSSEKTAIEQVYKTLSKSGESAFIKMTQEQSSKNVNEAFNYIYSVLPKNMRALLEGTYIINGGQKGKGINYSAEIIKQAILADNETDFKIDYSNPINLDGSDSAGGSSKSHRLSILEKFLNADLNKRDMVVNKGDGTSIVFHDATYVSGIPTFNNHSASNLPLEYALSFGLGTFLDYSKVFFGDQKVSRYALSQAVVGQEDSAVVYAPVNADGDIDFKRKDAFDKAEAEIKRMNITNDIQKNLIHREYKSPGKYKNGELDTSDNQVKKFYLTYATVSDDIIDDENVFKKELSKNDEENFRIFAENLYDSKKMIEEGYENPFGRLDDLYRVPVFIAINEYAAYDAATYEGHGPLQQSTSTGYQMQQQLEQKVTQVTGNTQLLFQEQ